MGSSSSTSTKPVVVIVGGGYGGVAAAKLLDATGELFVILIDRKNYFLHKGGSLRAACDASIASLVLIPYENLLKNGIFIQADVTEIAPTGITLHGRAEPIQFSYLIIATGSSYAFPCRVVEPKIELALERYKSFNQHLLTRNPKNIVIVGGGSVGIELAGELHEVLPESRIKIVHSSSKLMHNDPLKQEFLDGVVKQLNERNITVRYNDRIELNFDKLPEGTYHDASIASCAYWGLNEVVTSTRTQLPCDLLLFSGGAQNNTRSLSHPAWQKVMFDGRLEVNTYMQVKGYTNVFAIGDIAAAATKRAVYASMQGEIAAKNIIALNKFAIKMSKLSASASKVTPLFASSTPSSQPKLHPFIIHAGYLLELSIGADGGMSQMSNASQTVYGASASRQMKSRDLYIEEQWKKLNQASMFTQLVKATKMKFNVDSHRNAQQVNAATQILGDLEETKNILRDGLPNIQDHQTRPNHEQHI